MKWCGHMWKQEPFCDRLTIPIESLPAKQRNKMRARDLGIIIGTLSPGPNDAITELAGVRVGSTTLIEEEPPSINRADAKELKRAPQASLRVPTAGRGPIHTGVTVVMPHEGNIWKEPLFAGCHSLNVNGEMTGLEWDKQIGGIVIEHWD